MYAYHPFLQLDLLWLILWLLKRQYYSAVLVKFEPVCYYCGLGDDGALVEDKVTELKKSYAFVAPICLMMTKMVSCQLMLRSQL